MENSMKVMCGMKILLTSEEKNGIVRIGAAMKTNIFPGNIN